MEIPSVEGWPSVLRGDVLPLAILGQLQKPKCSAELFRTLQRRGLLNEPGELPPLLRQMEKQKLLKGNWEETGSRPRKYYSLSSSGKEVFVKMDNEWQKVNGELHRLLEGDGGNDVN